MSGRALIAVIGACLLSATGCGIDSGTGGTQFKCSDAEPCPSGFGCEFGICVATSPGNCTPLIHDDFDDDQRADTWDAIETAGTTVSETDGVLVVTPAGDTSDSEGGYRSVDQFNLLDRRLVVEVPQMVFLGRPEGPNVVTNSDFAGADIAPWELMTSGTGAGSTTIETGELRLAITDGGSNAFDVQLIQSGLQLDQGVLYVVRFQARSPAPRSIEVNINLGVAPFTLYFQETVDLTTTMDTYTFEFVMAEPSDADARIDFNVGTSTVNVFFDNVEVVTHRDEGDDAPLAILRAGDIDGSNYLFVGQQTGELFVGERIPGDANVLDVTTYDPAAHRFWQLREQDGTTYFETSADGASWTTHSTLPTPASNSGAFVDLTANANEVSSDPGQLRMDNVRLLPADCE